MSVEELPDYTKGAVLSADGTYRYYLERRWSGGNGKGLGFIMLNPSTADAEIDDPTIRRCVGFAHGWGYSSIHVANLMAFRSTNPSELPNDRATAKGPLRDYYLWRLGNVFCETVVAAWGSKRPRWFGENEVARTVWAIDADCLGRNSKRLVCFGKTKSGDPKHPLYLPGDAALEAYRP